VSSKILEIDDVAPTFPRRRQGGDSHGMNRYGRIEAETADIYIKEGLDGSSRHRPGHEAVSPLAASGACWEEKGQVAAVATAAAIQPDLQSLECLGVQRHSPLLSSLAPDFEHFVPARFLVVHHAKPAKLSHAATGVSEDGKERPISNTHGGRRIRSIEQAAAIFWGERDRFAISRHRRSRHKLAVGRVRSRVAVD
jgi:hypothetical protein